MKLALKKWKANEKKITHFSFYKMLLSYEIIPNHNIHILHSYPVVNESHQRNKCEEQFIILRKLYDVLFFQMPFLF